MKEIKLTQGQVAFIDDEDYEKVNKYKWFAQWNKESKTFYARSTGPVDKGKQNHVFMHRFILGMGNGWIDKRLVNHKNHNGLDNTRNNIEITNKRGNGENMRNQSPYGVGIKYREKQKSKPYELWIGIDGKQKYVGIFPDIESAKLAREKYLEKYEQKVANV